ncbi:MAG: adenosylhomocysteinase [Bdellovibrionaceae bacterium]|nr:adenosylhomocysteinase [Pseudobdellovibrionaceae bacterium]
MVSISLAVRGSIWDSRTVTTSTKDQADYIGVAVGGPYKPEQYRY